MGMGLVTPHGGSNGAQYSGREITYVPLGVWPALVDKA
jgi:hypothetical protein